MQHAECACRDTLGHRWRHFDLDPTLAVVRQRALPKHKELPPSGELFGAWTALSASGDEHRYPALFAGCRREESESITTRILAHPATVRMIRAWPAKTIRPPRFGTHKTTVSTEYSSSDAGKAPRAPFSSIGIPTHAGQTQRKNLRQVSSAQVFTCVKCSPMNAA